MVTALYRSFPVEKLSQVLESVLANEVKPDFMGSFLQDVDLTQIEEIRDTFRDAGLSYKAFVVKAAAKALNDFPYANRRLCFFPWPFSNHARFQQFTRSDVTIRVESPKEESAYLAILRDADQLSLHGITEALQGRGPYAVSPSSNALARLAEQFPLWMVKALARLPFFVPSLWVKHRGGAVHVVSAKEYGIDRVVASWPWPVGFSFGDPKDHPVERDGKIVAGRTFVLSLNFDRRVMLEGQATAFFRRVIGILENAKKEIPDVMTSKEVASSESAGQSNRYRLEPEPKMARIIRNVLDAEMRPDGVTPVFYHQLDLSEMEELRAASGDRPATHAAYVTKAVALALKEFPLANRRVCNRSTFFSKLRLQKFKGSDVSVLSEASADGEKSGANYSRILRDADRMSLEEIERELAFASKPPREPPPFSLRWLSSRFPTWVSIMLARLPLFFPALWAKYRGGAACVFSLSGDEIDMVTSHVAWPLGISIGSVKKRPMVIQGKLSLCPTSTLCLGFDRRIMGGGEAARFFRRMIDVLEHAKTELAGHLEPTGENKTTSSETTSISRYQIEPVSKFFQALCGILGELHGCYTETFLHEVDLTQIENLRKTTKDQRPSYTAFVLKAAALALSDCSFANQRLFPGLFGSRRIEFLERNVAVAAERMAERAQGGIAYIMPLYNVDQLSLIDLTRQLHDIAHSDDNQQWETFSKIATTLPTWLAVALILFPTWVPSMWRKYRGGPVLVSSPAKYGIDMVAAVWAWPLGISFGLVKDSAAVRAGNVMLRKTFTLMLNFDRRVMAEKKAARFFRRMIDVLEHAETEMAVS